MIELKEYLKLATGEAIQASTHAFHFCRVWFSHHIKLYDKYFIIHFNGQNNRQKKKTHKKHCVCTQEYLLLNIFFKSFPNFVYILVPQTLCLQLRIFIAKCIFISFSTLYVYIHQCDSKENVFLPLRFLLFQSD